MNSGYEPYLPLIYNSGSGPYLMITNTQEMIHQNLKNLFLTNPGEKIMDLNFGIGINSFLFEIKNANFQQDLNSKINQQVNKYMSYIKILNINTEQDNNTFYVILRYGLSGPNNGAKFTFKLDVQV